MITFGVVLAVLLTIGFILLILKKDRLFFDVMLYIVGLFACLGGFLGGGGNP